jgi:hypothetical protein
MGGTFAGGPRVEGIPVVASSAFGYAGTDAARFVGDLFSCGPGSSRHSRRVEGPIRLQGGSFWTRGGSVGDRVSLSVVDLDDVLGGGAGVVVSEYVSRIPVPPGDYSQAIESPTAGTIPAGLYLVVDYENAGTSAVDLGITWRWFVAG